MPPLAPTKPQIRPITVPQATDCTGVNRLHGLFGGHDGLDNELDALQFVEKIWFQV